MRVATQTLPNVITAGDIGSNIERMTLDAVTGLRAEVVFNTPGHQQIAKSVLMQ